jgi:YD repeat-containing protein
MDESRRKLLMVVLAILSLAAVVRIGSVGYRSWEERKAAERAVEMRFRPSERVLALLNRTDAGAPSFDGRFPCVSATVTNSGVNPEVTSCLMPTTHSGSVDRFEADLRYGRFILRQSDLYLNDVFEVPLTRTYNSGDYIHPNRVHAFGKSTNHPYDIAPLGTRNPYTYNLIAFEDGDFLFFNRVSEGTSYADAIFQHTETSTRFYKAVTAWNGDGWTTFLSDGSTIVFPEAYLAKNMAQGAPTEMRDTQGNSLRFLRDQQRNLLEIRTPHGHSIKFQYDGQSRIAKAQDDQGQWAEYRYDDNGMLTDMANSSGHRRHYSYEGLLMTVIEDENQNVLLRNSYEYGRLTRQDFGKGRVYSYAYSPSSGAYAETVSVTLPDATGTNIETAQSVPSFVKNRPQ